MVEALEGRPLPSGIGFVAALGVGAAGSAAAIHADAVADDAAGDRFLTGSFRGTADFDPNSSASTFTTAGTQDTFVAKYTPAGSLAWAITFAGRQTTNANGFTTNAVAQGSAIAVDGQGEVFVAGGFSGTIALAGASGVTQVSSVASASEPYVAKLDPSGRVLWFDAVAGTAYDTDAANALALDGSGGAILAGSFEDQATFGGTILAAGGSSDAFVARVDAGGNYLWAVATRGMNGSNASALGVAVDGSGDVDLAGLFSGSVDFDPSRGSTVLTSAGSDDAALWKLDSTGKLLWARSYGSSDYDAATAVAVDASGDFYAVGAFSDTVAFGPSSRPDAITAGPADDAFLVKVDPNGNELWVDGLVGPSGSSEALGVAVDRLGIAHVAGAFSGPLDFAPGPGTDTLTSVGSSDAFSAGYGPGGALIYALQAGQGNFNAALGVGLDGLGYVSIAGTYSGSITFGPTTLPSLGPATIFLARVATQIAPAAPSSPVLEPSSDTGISQSDGTTSDTAPVLDVNTAVASDTVELLRNGVLVAQRNGPGPLADPGPLRDGTYSYTALQVSPFGLASPASPPRPVTILTVPPAALPAPSLVAGDDSGTAGDGITNDSRPRLAVVAPGGVTVQLLNASGVVLASAYRATAGTCILGPLATLADGAYSVRARAVDVAGNVGTTGPAFTLTIDTTPPAAPSSLSLLAADDSGTSGDDLTNVRQPRLTGAAEPGSTVQVVDGRGNVAGSAVAASNGAFTVKVASPLPDGTYVLSAIATDAAGNPGPAGLAITLTILGTPPPAPSAPSLLPADDSGGPGLTNVRQPRLAGKATGGDVVQLLGPTGAVLASTTARPDGSYVAKLTSPLADGTYAIDAESVDAAGNVGPAGPAFSLTILTTPPPAPSAPNLPAQDDSGTVGDGLTNVRQPRLAGTATAGTTVRLVTASGTVLGSTTASSTGVVAVSPSSPLADGTYPLELMAVDAAGNLSIPGGTFTLTILATPPPRPAAPALLAADDTGAIGDGRTSVRRPRLVGTAAPGGRVDWLAANGSVLASATASASNGAYQLQTPSALANASYSVTVRETDAAGNVSATSPAFSLTIRADPGDVFATGQADLVVDRTSDGDFFAQKPPSNALVVSQVGQAGDVPNNGDFFGDGRGDIAVYRPSTSTFLAVDPATGASKTVPLGQAGDVPVPADYDGDGLTDFAVFRPGTSTFIILDSATGTTTTRAFGTSGDIPVPADYFGNGHADFAIYRPSTATFYVYDPIGGGTKVVTLGTPGATPVPADYEGVGHVDPAVYQPGNSTFVILMSATNTIFSRAFGGPGDIPIPGDYLGNGRADLAIYRPSTATFYSLDIPTQAAKIVSWGTPYVTWPTLAPITTWFSFGGGSGGGNAIRPPRPSPAVLLPPPPEVPDFGMLPPPDPLTITAPASEAGAVDRAIESLALDGWRPVA